MKRSFINQVKSSQVKVSKGMEVGVLPRAHALPQISYAVRAPVVVITTGVTGFVEVAKEVAKVTKEAKVIKVVEVVKLPLSLFLLKVLLIVVGTKSGFKLKFKFKQK